MTDYRLCRIKPLTVQHTWNTDLAVTISTLEFLQNIDGWKGINLTWANLLNQPSLYDKCVSLVTRTMPPGIFQRDVPEAPTAGLTSLGPC